MATSTCSTTAPTSSRRPALKPPKTWDDYLADAKALNGKDLNGDGTPDYGSCIAKKRNAQSYWFVTDIAGSMIQSKGTGQGTFFNTKDMKPLVNNEAFSKALDFLKESSKYGPPNETQPGRQRHAPAVRLGPVRAQSRLGRRRRARDRSEDLEGDRQGRCRHPAGLEAGAELGHRQARGLHRGRPARTRSTASTMRPSPPSAAGAAASMRTPRTR